MRHYKGLKLTNATYAREIIPFQQLLCCNWMKYSRALQFSNWILIERGGERDFIQCRHVHAVDNLESNDFYVYNERHSNFSLRQLDKKWWKRFFNDVRHFLSHPPAERDHRPPQHHHTLPTTDAIRKLNLLLACQLHYKVTNFSHNAIHLSRLDSYLGHLTAFLFFRSFAGREKTTTTTTAMMLSRLLLVAFLRNVKKTNCHHFHSETRRSQGARGRAADNRLRTDDSNHEFFL